jgi:hypothetical protein
MTSYQGHMADGSSVQKHSAGGAYPYVLQLRDNPNGGFYWDMIGPGIVGKLTFWTSEAWDAAVRRILAVRDNPDAWAFELEALCTVCGQKQAAMQAAARAWAGPASWGGAGPAKRVELLLWLGKARNTLKLPPMASRPVFAALAARQSE